ncbi:hypothetical protein AK812_SmicGene6512 [Symbiodinium microadriaticum]|uniref:Uncharacterized protein n=1 Tax=Symbiodinium microadriaticum TaxID=2951 RepID=A0A1Q9ER34_SYMMI|nr:hypothetical protein AK812_SmicGene6512 [Symbiodinium microadriaticum]
METPVKLVLRFRMQETPKPGNGDSPKHRLAAVGAVAKGTSKRSAGKPSASGSLAQHWKANAIGLGVSLAVAWRSCCGLGRISARLRLESYQAQPGRLPRY